MFVQWQEDVTMLSIASNRNEDAEAVKTVAEARGLPTVLLDVDCQVADLFDAKTTPHVFAVDREGLLRYRGAVDDVAFRQRIPTRFFLDMAIESMLAGQLPAQSESPLFGCAIVREI